MTSSLVGSEMCIRDSLLFVHNCGNGGMDRPGRFRFGTIRLAITGTTLSVSYTHLTLPTICSV
eukprot:5454391-Prorocentrum_lima.AAC.1